MGYIKCETEGASVTTSKRQLECCASYYRERGGKENQADYYKNRITDAQREARKAATRAWKLRNRRRVRSLMVASNTKKRIGRYLTGFDVWEMMGCDCEQLALYLDTQTHGEIDWLDTQQCEVDHIRPLCSFDLTGLSQVRECFHFSNLQVIAKGEHREKSRVEHLAFMDEKARQWWKQHRNSDYPGFKIAWHAFCIA